MRACMVAAVAALACPAGGAEVTPAQIKNHRCFNCHGQKHIARLSPAQRLTMVGSLSPGPAAGATTTPVPSDEPPVRKGLYVTAASLAYSKHAKLACVDCHRDAATLPHAAHLKPASCNATCHGSASSAYLRGEHAAAVARGAPHAPTCASCHGGHDILPSTNRTSRTYPLNIVKICGDCHRQHTSHTKGRHDGKAHVQRYLDSVHGRALVKAGLAVSATCADCHGNHRVLPSHNPESSVNRLNVEHTCGKCHVGLSETFRTSVHGRELDQGNTEAPTCTDCHTAHAITRTDVPSFKQDIVSECGQCHDKPVEGSHRKASLYATYRRSYHGQVTALGSARAARCSDCHGAHDIRRIDDPASRLSPANKVKTCQACHPDATPKFAEFMPHADFHDAERYPILHAVWMYFVIVMSFAFGFFGLHAVLWFLRSLVERIRHGRPARHAASTRAVRRFTKMNRANHWMMVLSFYGLTVTGLPLLYADYEWGQKLADAFGGPRGAGMLHRSFAILLGINFALHLGGIYKRWRKTSTKGMLTGPLTLLPRWKDVKDCAGMFRWFLLGGKQPTFDRWTYWEKFDYLAEIGGSLIIGVSGLLLWFPQFFAQFLPGWIFNVATIVHGYEALLAIVFIFTIHFFNANLRPGKFPVDEVIFTGQVTEEELAHERPEEYGRLVATGEIEALRVAPSPRWVRVVALLVGLAAMGVGITLAVLIIMAAVQG